MQQKIKKKKLLFFNVFLVFNKIKEQQNNQRSINAVGNYCSSQDFKSVPSVQYKYLVQTVKSPKGLSGKICPRKVSRVIRLSQGRSPKGKSDYPRNLLWANFSDNPWGLVTVCQKLGFKNQRIWGPELPHGLVWKNSRFGLAQVWQCLIQTLVVEEQSLDKHYMHIGACFFLFGCLVVWDAGTNKVITTSF